MEAKLSGKSEFVEEIFAEVCERMAAGKGLREICSDPEMPSRSTVLRWVENDTGRQAKYQKAREALMDWYAEEILKVAFDDSGDTFRDGERTVANHAKVQRDRLKVDTLKWTMSKLHPKRYGDKLELEGKAAEAPVQIRWERTIVDPETPQLRKRIQELEGMLGIGDGEPVPPKLLTYDPGPLPSRTEGQILYSIAQAIKNNVPKADQRPPEEVISEVMAEFERVLQAKYGSAEAA
jgi:hypothetical protein